MQTPPIDFASLDRFKSISHHADILGISRTTLKRRLIDAGIYHQFYYASGENTGKLKARVMRADYATSPKLCQCCSEPLSFEQRTYKFCSTGCAGKSNYASSERRRVQGLEIKRRIAEGTWKRPSPPPTPLAPRVDKPCQHCGKVMSLTPCYIQRKFCSRVCANEGYVATPKTGGYREGSGRGKSGWYQGVFCNSTWELAWVIYQLEHEIPFKRNTEGFPYLFEGASHLYYPDFIMGDGVYLEVKGYSSPQWLAKQAQFPHPLRVLTKTQMKPILAYVKAKHGTHFINLYEGNPHDTKTKQCVVCGKPCRNLVCSPVCSGKHSGRKRGWNILPAVE